MMGNQITDYLAVGEMIRARIAAKLPTLTIDSDRRDDSKADSLPHVQIVYLGDDIVNTRSEFQIVNQVWGVVLSCDPPSDGTLVLSLLRALHGLVLPQGYTPLKRVLIEDKPGESATGTMYYPFGFSTTFWYTFEE